MRDYKDGFVQIINIQDANLDDDVLFSDYFEKGEIMDYKVFISNCAEIFKDWKDSYGIEEVEASQTTDYTFWMSFFTDKRRELGFGLEFMYIANAFDQSMIDDFNNDIDSYYQ